MLRWVALVATATILLSLFGQVQAFAITRDTVLARAQTWVDAAVPYSQKKHYHGYRTDCSGYVSMCWKTGTSWDTKTFFHVSHTIAASALKPGDALLKRGYHIMLFYGWLDPAHTYFVAYEQTGPAKADIQSIASDIGAGYKPVRYDKIEDSPAPSNLILNPSFDTWDYYRGLPAWWSSGWGADVVRRTDVSHTSRSSLELDVPSFYGRDGVAGLSQTVAVSADETYTLSAWVMTDDPGSLVLSLQCLDASGAVLAEPSTAGDAWDLNAQVFTRMTLTAMMPPGTAQATVLVQLAEGPSGAAGSVGTSATVDDISLSPPPPMSTTTRLSSPSSGKVGTVLQLSGTVSAPAASATVTITTTRLVCGKWRSMGSVKVAVTSGTFACGFKPTAKGSWRFVATYSGGKRGTTTYARSKSSVRTVMVR